MRLEIKKFNTPLGNNSKVCAYSNGTNQYISEEHNFTKQHYTGFKWQCVEYARRWLYQTKGFSFSPVNYAYEIWINITCCYNPDTKKTIAFVNHSNLSSTPPLVGDLLVYAKTFLQTGHVAIVVEVNLEKKYLRVAEQNYHNTIWQAHYSREINMEVIKSPSQLCVYSINDPNILGWKSLAEKIKQPSYLK